MSPSDRLTESALRERLSALAGDSAEIGVEDLERLAIPGALAAAIVAAFAGRLAAMGAGSSVRMAIDEHGLVVDAVRARSALGPARVKGAILDAALLLAAAVRAGQSAA